MIPGVFRINLILKCSTMSLLSVILTHATKGDDINCSALAGPLLVGVVDILQEMYSHYRTQKAHSGTAYSAPLTMLAHGSILKSLTVTLLFINRFTKLNVSFFPVLALKDCDFRLGTALRDARSESFVETT